MSTSDATLTEKKNGPSFPPLLLFLTIVLLISLHIARNGYLCFRSDHQTQIPMFLMQEDKTLFARDWYFQEYGPVKLRQYPLMLLRVGSRLFGLPGGIFFFYFVFISLTILAWMKISNHVFRSSLPGVIAALLAICFHDQEIGSNPVLERILIPRTEAYVFAYWGLYLLLKNRFVWAGIFLSLSGYFQPAVGLLFGAPMMIWLLVRPERHRFRAALQFVGAFLVVLLPRLYNLRTEFIHPPSVSIQQEIILAAYVRHPHHMIPHLWGSFWVVFAAIFAVFLLVWLRMRTKEPGGWSFGLLAPIIMALLALATLFIEVWPNNDVIQLQTYRMAVLLYLVFFLVISPHILGLLQSGSFAGRCRAVAFMLSGSYWRMFLCVAVVEAVFLIYERRGKRVSNIQGLVSLALALTIASIWEPRSPAWRVAVETPLVAVGLGFLQTVGFFQRPKLLYSVLSTLVVAAAVFFTSFFWLPYEKWMTEAPEKPRKKYASRCLKFQMNPIPITSLERIGAWAQKNTPKNALFIIPPQRDNEGFGVWSRRSVLFCVKFFPYNPTGLAKWKERYLALRGVMLWKEKETDAITRNAFTNTRGDDVFRDYRHLTEDQILEIARHYGADYIVTPSHYTNKALEMLYKDIDYSRKIREHSTYRIYRIHLDEKPVSEAGGGPTAK